MTGEKNLTELKIPYVSRLTKVNGLVWLAFGVGVSSLVPWLFRFIFSDAQWQCFVANAMPGKKATEKYKSLLLIVRQVPPFIW